MRIVEAALSASDDGGILICGPEGVGKSRIAREALAAVSATGRETRWVAGTSAARDIPLGACSTWVPAGTSETVALLRGVIDALTTRSSATGPVVVGVDDVHLLDDLSAFVVHQIVARGAAKVVLTARDDTPIPAAIQEAWKAEHCDRLDVAPLTCDDTRELLSAALTGPLDADVTRRLWQLTGGNVLYLRNIVEHEVAAGAMVRRDGFWRWTGEPSLPPSLVGLIESRIGTLPESVGDVVDVVAVGEPIELAALTRITDPAAVEEAETRGLIMLEPAGAGIEVRVAHPLYGQVRRDRAARTRLRRLRGLVASELATSDDRDDLRVVVRRATLGLDSDLPADADLLLRAAYGAVWLADLPLADRLAQAADLAGAGAHSNLVRGHALSWLGRGQDAEDVLAAMSAADLCERDRARCAFLRSSNMLWALSNPERAKELIDDAAGTIATDAHDYIDAFRTVYWFAMDQPEEAVAAAHDLVPEDLPVAGTEVSWALAQIAADAGRTADAVSVADVGCAAATRGLDAPQMRFNIADAEVSALLLAGETQRAVDVAERVRAQAADLPGAAQLLGAAVAGRAALGAGRLDVACLLLQTAADGLSVAHAQGWGYRYRIAHITALALRGQTPQAAAALAAHREVRRAFRSLDHEQAIARAWVAAGEGAVSEAIGIVLSAAERACAAGRFADEVQCRQIATQFGDTTSTSRLRALESVVEGPRVGLAARFAAALHDAEGTDLLAVSTQFEEMGDLVAALDAAAHAALVFRRDGKRGSALAASTRADGLAEQCGGACTPAARQASEDLPLTDREREIVMLIGAGLTNREVAARLFLSVRTVESHVYRAMSKTGTTTRDELAALLRRRRRTGLQ
ncbi:helix-turn-helix transcriptional regulator [Gordonia sp. HNM0687]|uniref:Helix-turn-helix transcriptional regulator n=2 Tax=Gordonia mangrovi TaxID=2665643 RepID=A0A6L7GNW4_9ACTN|nr:helix-turn-helix transcriptional regulator [Gordonia mangrovi]MXP20238.1 helix-turn-helix transcriptional regulator [Gordonia mangrovi]UVF80610.1 helix-turn-helix transcriptional regulator [Gordonia mangrovi]